MSDGNGDEEIDEREEAEALGRIAHAISCYRSDANGEISRWEASAARLASRTQTGPKDAAAVAPLLSRLRAKHLAARAAAERNARWLDSLLEATVGLSSRSTEGEGEGEEEKGPGGGGGGGESGSGCSPYAPAAAAVARSLAAAGALPSAGEADKVRYVLKNAARDWSDAGRAERAASYGRMVEALSRALPPERGSAVGVAPGGGGGGGGGGKGGVAGEGGEGNGGGGGDAGCHSPSSSSSSSSSSSPPRVLVPGSGLGRLCVDLVAAGYAAQGNEFSYYMLLASAFALNFCCGAFGGGGGGAEEEEEEGGQEQEEGQEGQEQEEGQEEQEQEGQEGQEEEEERGGAGGRDQRERQPEKDPRPVIHPWVLTPCNWLRDADQLAGVRVPDVDPAGVVAEAEERRQRRRRERDISSSSDPAASSSHHHHHHHHHHQPQDHYPLLSMVAGDFAQVYSHPSREASFDAVATCFFLDTAHNVLEYVRTIKHVLVKNGRGTWVNLGPLLYHWADAASFLPGAEAEREEPSVELSLEEVLLAVAAAGFEIVELKTDVPATFNATPRSMLRSGYACAQWTAVLKKEEEGEGAMEGSEGEGAMEGSEAEAKKKECV